MDRTCISRLRLSSRYFLKYYILSCLSTLRMEMDGVTC